MNLAIFTFFLKYFWQLKTSKITVSFRIFFKISLFGETSPVQITLVQLLFTTASSFFKGPSL
jgi:hypothetical protein